MAGIVEGGQPPEHDLAPQPRQGHARARALAQSAKSTWFVPTAKNWANVESANVLRTMLTNILTGKQSVQQAAKSASDKITTILNASDLSAAEDARRVSSDPLPATAGDAAGAAFGPLRRHRRLDRGRGSSRRRCPYALIAPALIVIVAILGYPLYFLVRLSFEHYGLFQLIAHKGEWVGLDNFTDDPRATASSGDVVLRTVLFTAVNVGLTMVLGTLIALLLEGARPLMRIARHRGARARVVDAGRRRGAALALDDELRERRPQLRAHEARLRRLHPVRLVREPDRRLRRDHVADRLGRGPVRRDHRLRRADAGAGRAARGGRRSTARARSRASATSPSRS